MFDWLAKTLFPHEPLFIRRRKAAFFIFYAAVFIGLIAAVALLLTRLSK
jgi:hypothetical protein